MAYANSNIIAKVAQHCFQSSPYFDHKQLHELILLSLFNKDRVIKLTKPTESEY